MAPIHGKKAQILLSSGVGITMTNELFSDSGDHQHFTITNQAKRYLDPATSQVVQKANDELQSVTVTGSPTGGTFTLTFDGDTTANINHNASAATVQTELAALSSIGNGNVAVSGNAGGPWTVRLTGTLARVDQPLLTANAGGLTGGVTPDVVIAQVQAGSDWSTISNGYTLRFQSARVRFTSAQPLGTQVRISSGKYLVYSAVIGARSWTPDLERDVKEDTSMTTNSTPTRWRTFTPGLAGGSFKLSRWAQEDDAILTNLTTETPLIASMVLDVTTGKRLECQALMEKSSIASAIDDLTENDLDFKINGPLILVS